MKKFLLVTCFLIFSLALSAQNILEWANQLTHSVAGGYQAMIGCIKVDSNNVYLTGTFAGTIDFDPGPGVFNITSTSIYYDIFIAKYNISGNLVWVGSIGSSIGNWENLGLSLTIDPAGNVYTTGCFSGEADFDPGPGVYNLTPPANDYTNIFILKLDAMGNFVWAKQIGDGYTIIMGTAILLDDSLNVYTTGRFASNLDFDPGPGTFYMNDGGYYNVFISKLDSAGNFIWAKEFYGTGHDSATAMTADANGNLYITGGFDGTTDFNTGAGTFSMTAIGNRDAFVAKLDRNGNFIWAKQMGGTHEVYSNSITIDSSANVLMQEDLKELQILIRDPVCTILQQDWANQKFLCPN